MLPRAIPASWLTSISSELKQTPHTVSSKRSNYLLIISVSVNTDVTPQMSLSFLSKSGDEVSLYISHILCCWKLLIVINASHIKATFTLQMNVMMLPSASAQTVWSFICIKCIPEKIRWYQHIYIKSEFMCSELKSTANQWSHIWRHEMCAG